MSEIEVTHLDFYWDPVQPKPERDDGRRALLIRVRGFQNDAPYEDEFVFKDEGRSARLTDDNRIQREALKKALGESATNNLRTYTFFLYFALEHKSQFPTPLSAASFKSVRGWSSVGDEGRANSFTQLSKSPLIDKKNGRRLRKSIEVGFYTREGDPLSTTTLKSWLLDEADILKNLEDIAQSPTKKDTVPAYSSRRWEKYDPVHRNRARFIVREQLPQLESFNPSIEQVCQEYDANSDDEEKQLSIFVKKLIAHEKEGLLKIPDRLHEKYPQEQESLYERGFHACVLIGEGLFGHVWRVYDQNRKQWLAVKLLRERWHYNRTDTERFIRGAKIQEQLADFDVVPVIDPPNMNQLYFSMPYMAGGSLRRAVKEHGLSSELALLYIKRIGGTLTHAHQLNIYHRDIKPDNILFDLNGRVYLTDFDLGWHEEESGETITDEGGGTVPFKPPEYNAERGFKFAKGEADQYSLAMTLVFCLYGRDLPPRATYNAQQFAISELDCSHNIKGALYKALSTDKHDRWSSVGEFLEALDERPSRSIEQDIENLELLKRIIDPPEWIDTRLAQMIESESQPRLWDLLDYETEVTSLLRATDDAVVKIRRANRWLSIIFRPEDNVDNSVKIWRPALDFILYYAIALATICVTFPRGRQEAIKVKTSCYGGEEIVTIRFSSNFKAPTLYALLHEKNPVVGHNGPLERTYSMMRRILGHCRGTMNISDVSRGIEIKLTLPANRVQARGRW